MEHVTVTLEKWNGSKKEFEFEHASRLLNITSGGWKIDSKSIYKFTNGNIIRKQNKPVTKSKDKV